MCGWSCGGTDAPTTAAVSTLRSVHYSPRSRRPRTKCLAPLPRYAVGSASMWGSVLILDTAHKSFYDWRDDGLFEKINFALLLRAREAAGREPSPLAGVID